MAEIVGISLAVGIAVGCLIYAYIRWAYDWKGDE